MTMVKEQAVEMLKSLPDEKVVFLIKIMEGLEGLGNTPKRNKKRTALEDMDKFVIATERGENADEYVNELRG